MRIFTVIGLVVVLLSVTVPAVAQPVPPASGESAWEAMYAAWRQGGEQAVRDWVRANKPRVTREMLADVAQRGWKERSDAALSEARLAIALAAAQELGDQKAEADALYKAGHYTTVTGGGEKALALFDRAQALFESIGDASGQGTVWDGRASALVRLGKTAEALAAWEKALAFYEQAGNLKGQGNVYRVRGDFLAKSGDAAQARAMFDKALALFEEAGDPAGRAYVYRGQAELLDIAGERDKSLALLGQALALFEQAEDVGGQATTTFLIGNRHLGRGQHDKALAMFDRALPLFERLNDTLGQGNVYRARADVAYRTGETIRARELLDRAMLFYNKGNDALGQAATWMKLGEVAARLGDNAQARACYEKASAAFEKIGNARGVAETCFLRGLNYTRTGDNALAIAMFEQSLPLYAKANATQGQGNANLFLADVYYRMSKLAKALEFSDRALPFLEKTGNPISLASAYVNRGNVYAAADDHEKAMAMYDKALPYYEKANDPIGQGNVFLFRSEVYHSSGDRARALAMLERALPFFEKASDPSHLGTLYVRWGDLLADGGDDVQALAMYEKSLPHFDKISSSLGRGQVLRGLGGIRHRQGDDSQALVLYEQALACLRKTQCGHGEADVLADEAKLHAEAGRNDLALQRYEQALDLKDQFRRNIGLEELQLSFMAGNLSTYEAATSFMLKKGYGEQAFRAAERMKARVFLDRLAEGLVDLDKGVDPELKSRRDALESQSNALAKQRLDLYSATLTDEARAQAIARMSGEIEAADQELGEVKDKIRLTNPLYASVQYPQAPASAEIRSVLREGEVLLEYFLTGKEAWCFVLSRTRFDAVRLPGTPVEIATGVAALVEWAASAGRGAATRPVARAEDGGAAGRLYDLLIAPVAGKIAGKTLVIVPDGVLARLPFEMLEVGSGRRAKPLLRLYQIRYAPSAAVLAFYRTQYRREGTSDRFVGFGDPVYDHESFAAQRAERGVTVASGGLAGAQAQRGFDRAGVALARLPGTGEEVKTIGALFGTSKKAETSYLRLEASEAHAKERDLSSYGYIHFAAHGILDDDYQAIALSQVPGASEDGLLTLPEIMNLDWDARLVVLSACETGLGPVRRGEGVTGLTRAVMYAGSPAAVVSLWSVSDEGTKELMTRFYGAMVGKNLAPADALRQAKLELASSSRWRSPYYWAAFVLYGE